MRTNLKEIAKKAAEEGLNIHEAEKKYQLTSCQKWVVKQYMAELPVNKKTNPGKAAAKTQKEKDEDLEILIQVAKEMQARKIPRPAEVVHYKGKRYINITNKIIDCGD